MTTSIVYAAAGNLGHLRASGGIWGGSKLSDGRTDTKPQYSGGQLTFSRRAGTKGIYCSRQK
jgi:hypothetical protein